MTGSVVHLNFGTKRAVESVTADPKNTVRSERFFKLADDWYFTTRENVTLGPFESREEAKMAVADFVDFINNASPKIVQVFKGDEVQESSVV